ncbi:hypothetical protein E1B28_002867 [Marasmius oreades]|uniref:F-box domain-containing protein n=1 Tax=Marasmius oreades TaxID=181124 RepID=A0A9P7RPI7_9AGAR|nr:uncharacterized protein E1B28_002867 [Marasmius oreades]KAG7086950.1 hypothetical protein E1B28_002867 [Marasmius oreades]
MSKPLVLCERCNEPFTPGCPVQNLPPLSKSHFRSSNFPLNPENLTEILSNITEEEHQLQTLLCRITHAKQTLEDLERHKTHLETRLSERRSLLTTSRRIPTEIWTEIFSLCIPSAGHHLSISEFEWNGVQSVPYTLSHVCTRWRDIIASFPALWSSIWINLYCLDRNITPLLSSYFGLSSKGKGPQVYVQFQKGSVSDWVQWKNQSTYIDCLRDGPWTPYSEKAFSFILAHSARFRTFSVRDVDVSIRPALPLPVYEPDELGERHSHRLSFPLLESLTFNADISSDSPPSWLCDAIKTSPDLQVLKLDSTTGRFGRLGSTTVSDLLSSLPIKTLEIGNISLFERQLVDLINLLPSLHNLEVLQVDGIQRSSSTLYPILATATNRSLKSLTLGFGNPTPNDVVYSLLESVDLPSLESLEFKGYAQRLDGSVLPLFQKFGGLRNLSLSLSIHPDDDEDDGASEGLSIHYILRAVPRLESLNVSIKGGGGRREGRACIATFFDSFARDEVLGSHLRKLNITELDAVLTSSVAECVVSSLETRAAAGSDLGEVRLVFGGWRYADMNLITSTTGTESGIGERFRVIEERCRIKCAFFYTSWGSRSFVFGSKTLDE